MAESKPSKPKKSTNKAAKQPVEKPVADRPVQKDSWSWLNGNLLWGGFFILLGLLFLLANLGLVNIAWGEIWKLWPVVIIIVGLSILSLRGWLSAVVYGIAAILIVALVWVTLTGNLATSQEGEVRQDFNVARDSDDVRRLDVNIETGASSLNISANNGDDMLVGRFESRVSELEQTSEVDGDVQEITLSQKRNVRLFEPGPLNKLDVRLNKDILTRLDIDSGASSIDADLSEIMLETLEVDSGASSLKIRLGDRHDRTDVRIDTGVSSVTLHVPEGSGVKLVLDAGLSSRDLPEGFEETAKDTYQSANYDDADNKITISVDMGVSSFKLLTY